MVYAYSLQTVWYFVGECVWDLTCDMTAALAAATRTAGAIPGAREPVPLRPGVLAATVEPRLSSIHCAEVQSARAVNTEIRSQARSRTV